MATLLQIKKINKAYGTHVILKDADLNISEKEKIAVIGRNGAGKSTLFKIIVGQEEKNSGEIDIHPNTKLGYLTQHDPYKSDEIVIDFLMRDSGKQDFECAKIAGQFQIKGEMLTREIGSFAGGYQMRIKLISMLLKEPNLLLLDEPTNYLDLSTQLLLEKFLQQYKGGFLLISHDREFIKKTCNKTVEIEHGKINFYPKPLEEYFQYKEEQLELRKKHNKKVEKEKKHLQKFVDRFSAKASKASQAQSKLKQLQKLKTIEIVNPIRASRIKIKDTENKIGVALDIEEMSIGYGKKVVAKNIRLDIQRGEHIAVLGDNGQGKTTFLKTIAGDLESLSGKFKWGSNIKIGYYAQHVITNLNSEETVRQYLENAAPSDTSDQDIFEMAGNFLFQDTALDKKVQVLSGGEKARLCLAGLLLEKNNVLLMDEPTNHLDFETVESLALALKESKNTVIFVSHNRTFVDILANGIVEVKNGNVKRYLHNYEEYVYHLKSNIDSDLDDKKAEKCAPNKKNEDKVLKRLEVKELKKQLRKIEKELKKISDEKTELLKWFEENYTEFSKEKTERLNAITKKHDELEEKWMELELELDAK